MQYIEIFFNRKKKKMKIPLEIFLCLQYIEIFFKRKKNVMFFYAFLKFAQTIDCGYTLETPRRGGSYEYP